MRIIEYVAMYLIIKKSWGSLIFQGFFLPLHQPNVDHS